MRVEDSALTPDVRAAQVRKGTRLPSETTKLSVSRSARSAVTRFVPSYPAFQVTPPYLNRQEAQMKWTGLQEDRSALVLIIV